MSLAMMSEQDRKRQRAKNLALALTIGGLCLLFYVITIVRMGTQ